MWFGRSVGKGRRSEVKWSVHYLIRFSAPLHLRPRCHTSHHETMHRASFLLLFLPLWKLPRVAALHSGKWCFAGCELALNYADFNDTDAGSKKIRSCQSTLRATSLYLCIDEYCDERGRSEWLRVSNETCIGIANATLPPYDIIAGYSPQERAEIRRLSADEALTYPTAGEVLIPEESFFERAFTTLVWPRSWSRASPI